MSDYICPHCGKPVSDDKALLCLYCGESLGRSAGFMGRLRYPKHAIFITVLIIIVLLSFMLLMIL